MPVHITPASANPVLDTLTQEFLDRFPGPPRSIEELRERTFDPHAAHGAAARLVDVDIEFPPDHIRGRLILPEGAGSPSPVLVFFCTAKAGDDGTMNAEGLCRSLAVASQIAVLCLDTSRGALSARVANALSALSGIRHNGRSLGLDGSRLAVAGDGIGAKVAAVVSMVAKDRPAPALALQILFNPILSDRLETASYEAFAEGPWMTGELMSQIVKELDEFADVALPSPTEARIRELEGMPPTLVMTAENDIARDEGEEFARKLMQAGVRVNAVRFLGTIHDFAVLEPLADTPAARGAVAHAAALLKETFNR
ncbi:alpha/beta hydrolase fold domain-containing protein [Rhizobium bangladeshense]|nr:alpha/beta hydrolase fold domain-containing protein [Rhizobium bangladeshense]MBX4887641.1 alpha/beta hydrolase fold domain-containing protein [Rhizobium bangladeshense]